MMNSMFFVSVAVVSSTYTCLVLSFLTFINFHLMYSSAAS